MSLKFKITILSLILILITLCIWLVYFIYLPRNDNADAYGVYLGLNPEDIGDRDLAKVMVIDAQYFTDAEISELKDQGHTVYTYLNIGSVEEFRDYFQDYEDITLGSYENWEDERWVDVSNEKWQQFISDKADELLAKGVDGFFIDNCDVYYNYPSSEIFEGLTDILTNLKNKGAYVLINGGDTFVTEYYNLNGSLDLILDGVNQESVYTAIDWDNDCFSVNPDEEREYFTDYLKLVMSEGKDGYALEYTDDEQVAEDAIKYSKKIGYEIYISDSLNLD